MLKIFISSTCYDLKEERKHISEGLKSMGYEVAMSENGDILFNPDNHTHTDCIKAIKKQQILIYLIGYRFGGIAIENAKAETDFKALESNNAFFKSNSNLSITQCEVLTAIENNIPVYAFIRKELLVQHEVYEKNKKLGFPDDFNFPKIKNLEEAKYIFEFFNYLRTRINDNSYEGFEYSSDVVQYMKKQLSNYFSELISERSSSVIDSNKAEVLPAIVTEHGDKEREDIFDKFHQNLKKDDTIRILGTGVTKFLQREDRIHSILKGGNNIEILLINNEIIKNDWNCTSEEFIERINSDEELNITIPAELKVHCPLADVNFLIDKNHFNKYYSQTGYNEKIRKSIDLIRNYKEEYRDKVGYGTIDAKHFKSFAPLSITAMYSKNLEDNDLIAEFILPFTMNRIIFHSVNDGNSTVYRLFMDFFEATWDNSNHILVL